MPAPSQKPLPYHHLLRCALSLGLTDTDILLGYLGGFVARASTVAISLFLPLFVNTYFFSHGFCQGSPTDPSPELKKECRQAYVLASILSGVAQLVGLVCAPLFGHLSSRRGRVNWPIVVATTTGVVGFVAFPMLESPEFRDVEGRGGSPLVFLLAALMGVSQIGAIVCSLGSLGRGVLKADVVNVLAGPDGDRETLVEAADGEDDTAPLLENEVALPEDTVSRVRLKGSVAGVYSWCGGAAILLLTKLGGYLFDVWSTGAPFYLMAMFNAVLLFASIAIDVGRAARSRRR
jgi:MFS family permease